jgi:hypothetical protein
MSKDTDKNLFIVSPLHAQFYQQLLSKHVGFHELGTRFARQAERSYIFREVKRAEQAARLLINVPIPQYQLIGQYYLAWGEYVRGADVKITFERIAERAPLHYRARAMHALATLAAREKDSASELGWIMESMKVSPSLEGLRGMAILKAREGFHSSSIKDLENCLPFARYADPLSCCDYLNSYAVELGEAGRLNEARNVTRLVLASPFAYAYPEWQETAEELKPANRSFVVPDPSPPHMGKLLSMPVVEHAKPQRLNRPARIINFLQWKKKMGKDDDDRYGLTPEQLKEMTPSEKLCYILNSINTDFTEADFDKVIALLDEINDKKKK